MVNKGIYRSVCSGTVNGGGAFEIRWKVEEVIEYLSLCIAELMYSATDGMLVDFMMVWLLTYSGRFVTLRSVLN